MVLPFSLALVCAFCLFYWVWVAQPRNGQERLRRLLQEQGSLACASFFPIDTHLTLGDWSRTCIVFEPKANKACIVTGGKTARTVDFDYFRNWQLLWTENPRSVAWRFDYVHIFFETNDFERPTLRVNLTSKAEGDRWNSKLSTLLA